jgi:hypothetical protein
MKRLAYALVIATAAFSGLYTVIYLARWEWHRALLAALFFVAAEVALATGAVISRLRALERRLDDGGWVGGSPATRARLAETAPPPRQPFSWLSSQGDRLNVFLPILRGAGVIASAAAWVVEHLARATARPVMESRLAERLAPFSWPAGGLLQGSAPAPRRRIRRSAALRATVALVVLAGAWSSVGALADATQTRPEQHMPGVQTVFELRLDGRRAVGKYERMAAELWGVCRPALRRTLPTPRFEPGPGGTVRVVIDTDLGYRGSVRIRGCLEDAAVDHVQAAVLSVWRGRPGQG